ncbi:cilia- and flagella-associated protein HOATZ [Melanotaenia boesemani]|uniref:cilia- and flagella-associated protein HOATZ n=1 Tax=Melanotaenia boesemani TaxID=1250792 RepID=UPI001C044669|nr:cilia- and flagella-associated protein HOATZ [Melanotaenia boesemani]
MSLQTDAPEEAEFDQLFTVFDGSSPEDVSHARQLWSSLSLLPPLESRLMSADIRQRLQVFRPQRSSSTASAPPGPRPSAPELPDVFAPRQRQEERQRYKAMADQRKEILALLGRQRQQRIQKELVSAAFKPKMKVCRSRTVKPQENSDCEMEKEMVKQLI